MTHFKKTCAPTIIEKKGNHNKKYRVIVYYYARRFQRGEQKVREYETREEAENDQHNFRVELELGRKGNKIWAGITNGTPMENEDVSHYSYSQVNAVEGRELKIVRALFRNDPYSRFPILSKKTFHVLNTEEKQRRFKRLLLYAARRNRSFFKDD